MNDVWKEGNEPYPGTREDWVARAQSAEAQVEVIKAELIQAQARLAVVMKAERERCAARLDRIAAACEAKDDFAKSSTIQACAYDLRTLKDDEPIK